MELDVELDESGCEGIPRSAQLLLAAATQYSSMLEAEAEVEADATIEQQDTAGAGAVQELEAMADPESGMPPQKKQPT